MALVWRTMIWGGLAALEVSVSSGCAKGGEERAALGETSVARADSNEPAVLEGVSVTTGVYTAPQALRGHGVYSTSCGQCHTIGQHSGSTFAAAWNNRRLYDLYEIVRTTMPLDNPGGLSEQEYIDVVAFLLELNGVPAGKSPLRANPGALKALRIDMKPSAGR